MVIMLPWAIDVSLRILVCIVTYIYVPLSLQFYNTVSMIATVLVLYYNTMCHWMLSTYCMLSIYATVLLIRSY